MGNRAVITTSTDVEVDKSNDIGIYLHWNGGRDSVEAFLTYCRISGFRPPEQDCYGWARLCQVIGNFFGGDRLSVGIDRCCRLDCDNRDNGVYIIKDWQIVGRKFFSGNEQDQHDLREFIHKLDQAQPEKLRLGEEEVEKRLADLFGDTREEVQLSMTDKRKKLARKLTKETLGKIIDEYGFGIGFDFVATMLITDLLGFVMCQSLKSSGWNEYCELITEEAKRRAERVRDFETGIKQ